MRGVLVFRLCELVVRCLHFDCHRARRADISQRNNTGLQAGLYPVNVEAFSGLDKPIKFYEYFVEVIGLTSSENIGVH